jgi:tetratricopeptide (TPR) repeat protein
VPELDSRERSAIVPAPVVSKPAREPDEGVLRPAPQPSWWSLVVGVGGVLAFFAIALFASDWGEAARRSAGLATLLAAICLVTGLVMLLAGARGHWWAWLLASVLFFILGLYELPAAVVPLHLLQAQEAEVAGHYDVAFTELRLAGVPACDPRVTRDLLGWATADREAGRYGDAVLRLNALVHTCPGSRDAETAHDQIGQTELAWGDQLVSTGDYADAVSQYTIVQRDYPATPLYPAARQEAAAALVQWAQTLEHAGQYASALARYQQVLATYPDTPYVTTARLGAAQTLFDWGQWDVRNARYDDAVQRYSQLLDLYPNTPQADQAADLLRARQMVVGRLTHADGSPDVGATVRLSSEYSFGRNGYTTGGAQYSAVADNNGIFSLAAVPPGTYLLEWTGPNGRFTTFVDANDQPIELITVPRLHPLAVGDVLVDPSAGAESPSAP